MSKRYVATITLYTYGDSDKEALKEAEIICENLRKHYDNLASIEAFHSQPFGTMNSRKIDFKKLNTEDVEYF
mgnify:CR=1 FL=1